MVAKAGEAYLGDKKVGAPRYVRPADWLVMPSVNPGDQKVCLLVAVYNTESNFVALNFAGAYTVDWGDGSGLQNVATGVTATHSYTWASATGLTSQGFRQVIVTVTPQAGQNLTAMDVALLHSSQRTNQSTRWLEIKMAAANMTVLTLGKPTTLFHRMLQRFEWVGASSASRTDFSNMFYNCTSLQEVVGLDTSKVTNMYSMFLYCMMLPSVPDMDTSKVADFTHMFNNCKRLTTASMNTSAGVSMNYMFTSCSSLSSVTLTSTGPAADFTNTFQNCTALVEVSVDTSRATTTFQMFSGCSSLTEGPALDTGISTNVGGMFSGCTNLRSVPTYNTASSTTFVNTFMSCASLVEVPALTMTLAAVASNMFYNCYSLERIRAYGLRFGTTLVDCNLGPTQLNEFYTNLGTASGAQTITVTGNWGTATDNPAIATAKGWTVTG